MAQMPNVKLQLHPSFFDLLMTVLEKNTWSADEGTRSGAKDLMEKRMRYSRLYGEPGKSEYVSMRMYDSEASEMVWQLLTACVDSYEPEKSFSQDLRRGQE